MPTIELVNTETEISIGELFDKLEYSKYSPQTDDSGDSYFTNDFKISVLSKDGYELIEGYRLTKQDRIVELSFQDDQVIKTLLCSPEHIVMTNIGWKKVKDLLEKDLIYSLNKFVKFVSIKNINKSDRLYDLQVANTHSYYTNDVLSHNSHFLVQLGAAALMQGINIVHYTFELSETLVGKRYDSHICDIDFNDIPENKDHILKTYEDKKDQLGKLIIKHYPANSATIQTLRAHLERCATKGFIPGMIIVDYADVMRSSRQFDSLRHELKLVYEELRAFADELHLGIWSASQSNKEGSTSDVVDLTNMSEAYGKAMVADVVLSLSRKSSEKASGLGRLYVAKNRAGKDGILWPIKINTAKSKITISGQQALFEDANSNSNESDMKKAIRAKLAELENNSTLRSHKINEV